MPIFYIGSRAALFLSSIPDNIPIVKFGKILCDIALKILNTYTVKSILLKQLRDLRRKLVKLFSHSFLVETWNSKIFVDQSP